MPQKIAASIATLEWKQPNALATITNETLRKDSVEMDGLVISPSKGMKLTWKEEKLEWMMSYVI